MSAEDHAPMMRRALEAARRGWGDTHPNPMVGALIVENGRVVADGFHARAGEAHAEVAALKKLGRKPAPDAILYVTLEPCCTHGRTPPCTEAIIRAGIKRVVAGTIDPNPQHAGRGLEKLRAAGIEVVAGVLAEECADLNLIFNHWIVTTQPLFAGKIATTLDGFSATRTGQSQWITGTAARRDVMRWRRLFPAIGVGAGTVLADNPQLTSRIGKTAWCPIRLIFDRTLRSVTEKLPRVYADDHCARTVVVTGANPDATRRQRLAEQGVAVWEITAPTNTMWAKLLREKCAKAGLTGIYLEGGPTLLSTLLDARALDYFFAYRAPKFLADPGARGALAGPARPKLSDAFSLAEVRHASFGDDQLLRGRVVYPDEK